MKRRSFVKASLLTGAATTLLPASNMASSIIKPAKNETEFYELRVYTLKNATQQKLVEDYLRDAAIPALSRLGIKSVGVFTEMKPAGQTKLYVFIPFKSMDDFSHVTDSLDKDTAYQQQGSAYLNAPATEPAYERIESSLLKAFAHMPKMSLPGKQSRIFELRQYQSATESAGKKKIEMFNDQGEIDIFKRLGFKPVFFGETLIGPFRPNLTYMVTFDSLEEQAKHWKAFVADAEWKKISVVPGYADALLVSKITSTMIVPTDYSQI
ncbi:MAG TPA: NIPSNAP family protein [Mucilaginibacter sp.]|nr:NIPSNAP family protein [Mucilaginibacter sp.]